MKHRHKALGLIAGLVVTALFILYVIRALHGRDLSVYATPRAIEGIGVAALCWTMVVPLIALAWRGMLKGLGIQKSWRELTAILGITQFAKYVPGNIAQYLGRAGMSLTRGISARAFASTMMFELPLMAGAALCVGVGVGAMSAAGLLLLHRKGEQLVLITAVFLLTIVALIVLGKFMPRLILRLAPRRAYLLAGDLLPSRASMAVAFALYCLMYVCAGAGLVVLAHLLLPEAVHDNLLLVASFSLAWVVGFVTPGAPGGLGVREGLLLLMLAPVYSPASASVLVIALRIATTVGDSLSFASGFLILPKGKDKPSPEAPNC